MTTMTVDYDAIQALGERLQAEAPAQQGSSEKKFVEDGEYTAVIKGWELNDDEGKTPALIVKIYFPQQNLTEQAWFRVSEHEGALKSILAAFGRLKLAIKSWHPSELLKLAKRTEGWTVKVAKKSRMKDGKTYRDYYFNSIISQATKAPTPISNDEIPF